MKERIIIKIHENEEGFMLLLHKIKHEVCFKEKNQVTLEMP